MPPAPFLPSRGVQETFCCPFHTWPALLGSPHCWPWQSYLAESFFLGFVLQEEVHQLVQVILTVNLKGLGSKRTWLALLRQHRRGS